MGAAWCDFGGFAVERAAGDELDRRQQSCQCPDGSAFRGTAMPRNQDSTDRGIDDREEDRLLQLLLADDRCERKTMLHTNPRVAVGDTKVST